MKGGDVIGTKSDRQDLFCLVTAKLFLGYEEAANCEDHIVFNNMDRLLEVCEKMQKMTMIKPARIERCKFDKRGMLIPAEVIKDFFAEDEDEDE